MVTRFQITACWVTPVTINRTLSHMALLRFRTWSKYLDAHLVSFIPWIDGFLIHFIDSSCLVIILNETLLSPFLWFIYCWNYAEMISFKIWNFIRDRIWSVVIRSEHFLFGYILDKRVGFTFFKFLAFASKKFYFWVFNNSFKDTHKIFRKCHNSSSPFYKILILTFWKINPIVFGLTNYYLPQNFLPCWIWLSSISII